MIKPKICKCCGQLSTIVEFQKDRLECRACRNIAQSLRAKEFRLTPEYEKIKADKREALRIKRLSDQSWIEKQKQKDAKRNATHRVCRMCNIDKPIEKFYKTANRLTWTIDCMSCKEKAKRARIKADKPRYEAMMKRRQDAHRASAARVEKKRIADRMRSANPAYWKNDTTHKQRARRFGCHYEFVNKFDIYNRDGYKCMYCGVDVVVCKKYKHNQASIDHVVPMSKGGPHSPTNIVTCCMPCNMKKGNNLIADSRTLHTGQYTPGEGVGLF
jgi:hypothetical protein